MRHVRKRGSSFLAVGVNMKGMYLVATKRVPRVGTIKATVGTKGATLGVKRRIGRVRCEVGYNFTSKTPYARTRRVGIRKRRRF